MLVCAVLVLTAAVLVPAGEAHAVAYRGWGYHITTYGGEKTMPDNNVRRPQFWGYTTAGESGNSLINGTLNTSKNAGYGAVGYTDTNVSANMTYYLEVKIYKTNETIEVQTGSRLNDNGCGAYLNAFTTYNSNYARCMHKVTSSLYGNFVGHTIAGY